MSIVTQGYGHEAIVTQGYGHFNFGFLVLVLTFVTSNRRTITFDDYIEKDLDTVQTDAGEINSYLFQWEKQVGGLILGVLNKDL